MKTWREIGVEARARGFFTFEEMVRWGKPETCLIGEAVGFVNGGEYSAQNGSRVYHAIERTWRRTWSVAHDDPRDIQAETLRAISENDFDTFDRLLDQIEDAALEVKRQPGRI
jgi:hypothetical protein